VAAELHRRSDRAKGRFIATNCAAHPESLLEAELFGIQQSVATGVHARPGLFELASGGTLFLDEVGDMSPRMQAALLRVLEARAVARVGSDKPLPIDVRIVAATNVDLQAAMLEGRFRPDLFYRLDVLQLKLPPLRERRSDIPLLIDHFVTTICDRTGRERPAVTREFRETLMQSEWRGNVRELRNYIERLLAMTPEGEPLVADPLPSDLARRVRAGVPLVRDGLDAALRSYERQIIQRALREADGNQSAAARALKIGEPKLRYRLRILGDAGSRKILRPRKNPRKGGEGRD
jgi:transcriptional regulator with PAS, ATPase and Fis domain